MMRSVSSGLIVGMVLAATAVAQSEPTVQKFTPVSATEARLPVLAAGSPAAPGELVADASCHPTMRRAAIVSLAWAPAAAGPPGQAQRVDISKLRDGFARERYETSGRLAAATNAVAVEAPETGVNYYWRVLRETADGWAASAVGRFMVPICPWDGADRELPSAGGGAR